MTLEEALVEIERLKQENTNTTSRLTNAEGLIGRQGVELGDLRKFKTENEPVITTLRAEIVTLKETISKGGFTTTGHKQGEEEDPDKLEAELKPEQVKLLDEAWGRAPEETRKSISSDPKVRVAFIREAMKIASPAPETWRKSTRQAEEVKGTKIEDSVKELFDRHRPTRTQPSAGRAGSVREAGGGGGGEAERPSLNPSDVSGSLRRMRESKKSKE